VEIQGDLKLLLGFLWPIIFKIKLLNSREFYLATLYLCHGRKYDISKKLVTVRESGVHTLVFQNKVH
jgi:hypothetical protein